MWKAAGFREIKWSSTIEVEQNLSEGLRVFFAIESDFSYIFMWTGKPKEEAVSFIFQTTQISCLLRRWSDVRINGKY